MRMTRRVFGMGTLAVGLAGAGKGLAAAPAPTAARLQAELNACLAKNPAGAAFKVTAFKAITDPRTGGVDLRADVRLDWRPGVRQQPFRVSAPTLDDAYGHIRRHAVDVFSHVVPGFVPPARAV